MKLTIYVKPNSKKVYLRKEEDGSFTIAVREPALEGRANQAVIAALSEELNFPKSRILIVSGEKGKKKIVEVDF
ncbi:DUF167 domain-containing protein [Leptospira sp. WS92.C1]